MLKGLCLRYADAEEELTELDGGKAYIIGGIVDRNRHKGLCRSRAEAGGIRTARLPIRDYLRLQAAPVMTVNQVSVLSAVKWTQFQPPWRPVSLRRLASRQGTAIKRQHEQAICSMRCSALFLPGLVGRPLDSTISTLTGLLLAVCINTCQLPGAAGLAGGI